MERDILNFNNGLNVDGAVDALSAGSNGDIAKQLFADAESAEFLVPYKDKTTELCVLNMQEKGRMIPAFSSYAAFEKSPLPKDRAFIMPFSKIDEIVKKSGGKIAGIVINPHGKSLIFKHSEGSEAPGGEQKAREIKFMKPGSVPETITASLSGFFKESGNVYKAYLLWAQKDGDLAPHLFLIVDFDGKREEFFPKIAEVIRPYLKSGDGVEMAKANLKLLSAAEKLVKPFYEK